MVEKNDLENIEIEQTYHQDSGEGIALTIGESRGCTLAVNQWDDNSMELIATLRDQELVVRTDSNKHMTELELNSSDSIFG